MIYSFSRLILIVFFLSTAVVCVNAQSSDADLSQPSRGKEDLPKGIKESLAKSRIDREKKDYQELLQRGEEAAKISEELDKSFIQNKNLTLEDQRKLERLEKLSKKIREELGARDSDSSDRDTTDDANDANDVKLSSLPDAIDKLKNTAEKLSDELKKTTRYTVSAVAIQSSNAVLKIVRFIRQSRD